MFSKPNTRKRCLAIAILALVATLALGGSALASTLHPAIPGGLPANNAAKAAALVKQRASLDPGLAKSIAQNTGASTYVDGNYVADGYQQGAPGSANSGVNDDGTTIPTGDTTECNANSNMFRLRNTVTGQSALFCVGCGNLRLHPVQPPKPHPFAKGTVLNFVKIASKSVKGLCPGTDSTVVTVKVHSKVTASTWGTVLGRMKSRINAALQQRIKIGAKSICSKPTPAPAPTPVTPTPTPAGVCSVTITGGTITGNVNTCSSFTTVVVCGNISSGPITGSDTGDIVAKVIAWQQANCNTTTTPPVTPPTPTCPPGTVGTPPNCKTPPSTEHATVTNLTKLQDQGGILAGNTYQICADVGTSADMTVLFSADNGSVANPNPNPTINGTANRCADYTAPNDVQAGSDTYYAKVYYKGQVLAQTELTVTVLPQPPGRV